MSRQTTKPSTPRLSDLARHVVAPKGVVSTGWPAVEKKCTDLGVRFRPWQVPVGRLILAKRADGKYAATVGGTGLSIPRQVGKTFLVGAIVFALCLLIPNLTVIWTAHRLRTAEETFGKMQAFAKRGRIAPHVLQIIRGSGDEAILFRNGSRILFGARERGFGRGFDEVDVLIYDEAQILTENALDDMIPATNQSRQATSALLLFLGTPPKPTDPGEVFTRMRTEALSGEDPDTGWVEFGADKGYTPTPLPAALTAADWAQVAKANPSFPEDTPREAILRMRKKLGPESFIREGAGIWGETEGHQVISALKWSRCFDPDSEIIGESQFGLDVSPSQSWAAIGVAGQNVAGRLHVEVLQRDGVVDHRERTEWVAPRFKQLLEVFPNLTVRIVAGGPAKTLVLDLEALGIEVVSVPAQDVAAACGLVYNLATQPGEPGLAHLGTPELTEAVKVAKKLHEDGETAWRWGRKRSTGDITPLYAVTLAAWAAHQAQTADYDVLESAY